MVSLTNNDPGAGPPPPGNTGGGESPRRGRRDGPPTRIVRYGAMYWVGEFTHKPSTVLGWGTRVVVQTERGIELGECVGPPCGTYPGNLTPDQIDCFVRNCGLDFCQPRAGRILRAADDQDVSEHRHLNAHVHEDISHCAELAEHLALDLKIVTAEHLLGGERIVFYFRSPTRIDFRQLVKELAQHYRTRIEMRQVGARDEARLVADYEICGRECCCKNFLKKLRPVNMKMAKLQKSTLDPSKVSGRCGRLRCCLRYEHVGYEELAGRLPRPGSRVDTAFGAGTVVDRHVLTQLVAIRTDDERFYTQFMARVTPEDIRLRMMMPVREFSHQFLARMTQIDYAREMAFVALRYDSDGEPEMLGVVRFFADPDYEKAEYAVLARSNLKGIGLGWVLMRHLIRYARAEGLKVLYGTVLKENATMLQMCQALGFEVKRDPDDAMLYAVTLDVKGEAVAKLLAQQS